MHLAHTRSLYLLVFIACAVIIGSVVYLQHVFGLSPCVLCLWQRTLMAAVGIVCLIALLHAPGNTGCRRYSAALLLMALLGGAVAGAQVWLQTSTADELIPVIAWLEHLFDALSLHGLIERLRSDGIFCADITWSLFGISLPELSLLAFTGLTAVALYAFCRTLQHSKWAESRIGD